MKHLKKVFHSTLYSSLAAGSRNIRESCENPPADQVFNCLIRPLGEPVTYSMEEPMRLEMIRAAEEMKE